VACDLTAAALAFFALKPLVAARMRRLATERAVPQGIVPAHAAR
jgi:hypothetical protein